MALPMRMRDSQDRDGVVPQERKHSILRLSLARDNKPAQHQTRRRRYARMASMGVDEEQMHESRA